MGYLHNEMPFHKWGEVGAEESAIASVANRFRGVNRGPSYSYHKAERQLLKYSLNAEIRRRKIK